MNENIVIIGAPRSGTNILRDVLTSFAGIGTWPCDEINYIWRHGNLRYPSDEIPADRVTPAVAGYIVRKFDSIRRATRARVIVEKTCANSLRVPFVERVLPEAKYIFIYRDGIDATGSAKLRWTAELDLPYIASKVRYVPLADLPYYAIRYLWSRIHRMTSSEKRLAFWGPKLDGMEQVLQSHTLDEVCALQWQRCVESAEQAFADIPAERVLRIKYEDFASNPLEHIRGLLDFVGVEATEAKMQAVARSVSGSSVGKGRRALTPAVVERLEALVGKTLRHYGYV